MSETLNDPRIANGMRAQMELRQKLLDDGAKQIGWKVGLGAPAMQAKCGLTAPIVGFLLDRASLPPARRCRSPAGRSRSPRRRSPPISAATCPPAPTATRSAGRSRRSAPPSSSPMSTAPMDDVAGRARRRHLPAPRDPRTARHDAQRRPPRRAQGPRHPQRPGCPRPRRPRDQHRRSGQHRAPCRRRGRGGRRRPARRAVHHLRLADRTDVPGAGERSVDFELAPIGAVSVRFSA